MCSNQSNAESVWDFWLIENNNHKPNDAFCLDDIYGKKLKKVSNAFKKCNFIS